MHQTMSTKVLIIRSITLFCWGVYEIVLWTLIPYFSIKDPWLQIHLIINYWATNYFSTLIFNHGCNLLKIFKYHVFSFNKINHSSHITINKIPNARKWWVIHRLAYITLSELQRIFNFLSFSWIKRIFMVLP